MRRVGRRGSGRGGRSPPGLREPGDALLPEAGARRRAGGVGHPGRRPRRDRLATGSLACSGDRQLRLPGRVLHLPGPRSARLSTLAFLFPGQGSQRPGMGVQLLQERPDVVEPLLAEAEAESGLPLRALLSGGSPEELAPTDVAQPAIFLVSVALVRIATEMGLRPRLVAGHSLGEYTAAVAAGA